MKTTIFVWLMILLMSGLLVSAHSEHEEHSSFEQAEAIINAKIPCENLSEDQLEMLGDYYMEQIHPGEAHGTMDDMMGGEGSENLKQMHINMGKMFYCGDNGATMSSGMIDQMMGRSGIMGMTAGMMSPMGYSANGYGLMRIFSSFLYLIILIALMILIVLWILNQWNEFKRKRR